MPSNDHHSEHRTLSGPSRVFFAGWIAAVVVVVVATGGLVLARGFLIGRQVNELEQEAAAGPHVLVVPISRSAAEREISIPATVRGFDETDIYAKVAGYVKS